MLSATSSILSTSAATHTTFAILSAMLPISTTLFELHSHVRPNTATLTPHHHHHVLSYQRHVKHHITIIIYCHISAMSMSAISSIINSSVLLSNLASKSLFSFVLVIVI
jgi:hypothetical protein